MTQVSRRDRISVFGVTLVELSNIILFILLILIASALHGRWRETTYLVATNSTQATELASVVEARRQLEAEAALLRDENLQLSARVAVLEHAAKRTGGGRDVPSCFVGPDNRIQYLYEILIREKDLRVSPLWDESRASLVGAIPGAAELVSSSLSLDEFVKKAMPVYDWSVEQGCRFYVRVKDETTSKAEFKEKLRAVEAFFYKNLES